MSKLKYGMAAVGAIAASVGVVSLSGPLALAGEHMGARQLFNEQSFDQQSWAAQRAKQEYALLKQECDTLHYSQPQAYEQCLGKARSTRENLLAQGQGSQEGQGSQGFASNQTGQSGQKQGPIEKVTSVVKEKLVDWGLASPDQGRQSQQQGQGSQQGSSQGRNPLQASFDAGQGTQGQGLGQQSFGAAGGQGGQNAGQQALTQGQQFPQGQQFQGQQGQSGQGSFQGGNYGQQPQGQSWQQGTSGANQQFQSGGTQGSSSQQAGSTGAEEEHMDSVAYYQELARRQYATIKQECDALKKDPNVYEQCQTYAKSVRDKITAMAEQNAGSNQRGG